MVSSPPRSTKLRHAMQNDFGGAPLLDQEMFTLIEEYIQDGRDPPTTIQTMFACGVFACVFELALATSTKSHEDEQRNIAERTLAMYSWGIKRWGAEGGRIIATVLDLGNALYDALDEDDVVADLGGVKHELDVKRMFNNVISTCQEILKEDTVPNLSLFVPVD